MKNSFIIDIKAFVKFRVLGAKSKPRIFTNLAKSLSIWSSNSFAFKNNESLESIKPIKSIIYYS